MGVRLLPCRVCMGGMVLCKKEHLQVTDVSEMEWMLKSGHNFEHDHYSMGIFTCKSQYCASLRNLCANLVPIIY